MKKMNIIKCFNLFFVLIIIIFHNCSFSSKYKKKSKTFLKTQQERDYYSMVLFGNIGEVKYFKNLADQANEFKNKYEIEDFYNNIIFSQNINTDNFSCKVSDKNSNNYDLIKGNGLVHFETVFSDQATQNFIRKANEVVFFGDIINPQYKDLTSLLPDNRFDNFDFFESRIKCGWNIFINLLKNSKLAEFATQDQINKVNVSEKLNFIPGKYIREINKEHDENLIKNFGIFEDDQSAHHGEIVIENEIDCFRSPSLKKSKIIPLSKTPTLTTITHVEFILQIIDFDSQLMECLNRQDGPDYLNCNKLKFSQYSYSEALKYAYKINQILKTKIIKSHPNKRVWKVMRAFSPPIFSNDESNHFYFTNIIYTLDNGKTETINLWKTIRKSLINIFFSSWRNYAALDVIPFSIDNFSNEKFECYNKRFFDSGCYYYPKQNGIYNIYKHPFLKLKCDNDLFYKIPIKYNSNKLEENFMFVFNVGNSGISMNKIDFGYFSNSATLWARTQKDFNTNEHIYGYNHITFTKDYVEVIFMETKNDSKSSSSGSYKSATFRIADGEIINQKKLIDLIKKSICADYMIEGRSGTI